MIRSGGVVAYPTEYCYGLGCDPSQPQAVRKLLRLKYRRQYKGLILIAHRLSVLHRHVDSLPEKYREEILDSWPGPFTWLLPARRSVSRLVRGHHSSIAVRVTAHRQASMLCRLAGMALVSTSANRSGKVMLRTATSVATEFAGELDYIVDGRVGKASAPSVIRDGLTGALVRA